MDTVSMIGRAGRRSLLKTVFVAAVVSVMLVQTAIAVDPETVYRHGVDSLYNLDFGIAESDFKNLTTEHPENPLYWNSLASAIWLKILYDQQKLNIESFSLKDAFGTSQSKDEVSAAEEKRLNETIDTAISKSDALLKKNPKDVRALYAKGAAYATLATYHATVKREYWKARGEAASARDYHKQVLKIDPNYYDAEMSIGAYNYVMGILPFMFKVAVGILGMTGDGKEIGIRQIEDTARLGTQQATDAKMMLLIVYNREGRHEDALKIVDELHTKYPRNFQFEMTRAQIQRRMGKYDLALQTYHEILKKITLKINGYDRLRSAKVYYEIAKTQTEQKQFGAVFDTYGKIIDPKSDATPDERADSQIWMGMILDSQKMRPAALEHYNAVAKLNCSPIYKEKANAYIKRAYQP